jgi:hypothetical protein
MVKKIIVLILIISGKCYSQNLVSYATVNPDDVYIGQPVQLVVSVYSSTWFTSGIDVGNIQIDGALTVYFRSVSNSRTFSGKNYAGVDFFYNVFPTQEGTITIPSLTINVESPKPGGYKGIKHTITTKPKSVNVKGVPIGYDPNNWLVARSLNVTEKWSSPLQNVKVGDVLQRTISRSSAGTLSEFIPATQWDSVVGISLYPKRPQVSTNKSKTAVSARRTETVNYLFEKEGDITLPAIEYVYWNSRTKKFYKKQIDSISINVKPNADLAMLASIKKSLQKEGLTELEEETKPFLIFGLTPKVFIKYFIFLLLELYFLFIVFKRVIKFYRKKHSEYLKSEFYAFKKVTKTIRNNDINLFTKTSNAWLLKLETHDMTLKKLITDFGTDKFDKVINQINEDTYKLHEKSDKTNFEMLSNELKNARKRYFKEQKQVTSSKQKNNPWLNPTAFD